MNELLKQLGLIIMLIGVVLIIFAMGRGGNHNTILLWSLVIIIVGLITYITTNHFVED